MDKKQNRAVQPSQKGGATDSKKSQDVVSGKAWPRGGRRREPQGSSFPTKSEYSRKPNPQRNKTVDKRPKPRGGYYSGALGGKEGTRLADDEVTEYGSVFAKGSKKQSLNHLLNFHYASRETSNRHSGSSSHKHSAGPHRWLQTQKHKYNKEQFLQANCQFIVRSGSDYSIYMSNPDVLVDWDFVEQINVQVSEFPSCPICLYTPTAAKMTRCGHVYCWSCILHYLSLSDHTWRKCPICYEAVHKTDLKSAVAIPHNIFKVGEEITLRLMRRARGCLTAVPVDQSEQKDENVLLNMSETAVSTAYSKLLLAHPAEVISIIERERQELTGLLSQEENDPERCFIEEALNFLLERETSLMKKSNIVDIPKDNNNALFLPPRVVPALNEDLVNSVAKEDGVTNEEDDINSQYFLNGFLTEDDSLINSFNANSLEEEGNNDNVMPLEHDTSNIRNLVSSSSDEFVENSNILPPIGSTPSKYFYFYQATDGQHIYLHPLNVRMLEHTYGSLEKCPVSITGKIIEKEGGSMTEELRKRLRCLQHLPITCQFEVAEIQLKAPIVAKETIKHFQDQLDVRQKRRQRRAREEKRREKRITEEENRKLGHFPGANVRLESYLQFPRCGKESTSEAPVEIAESPKNDVLSSSSTTATSGSLDEHHAGLSFAKMLATGKSKPPAWPVLSPVKSKEPVVVVTKSSSKLIAVCNRSDSEAEKEEYAAAPSFNTTFGDAIAVALEKASKSGGNPDEGELGGKKKKKKGKQLLFATAMAYSEK